MSNNLVWSCLGVLLVACSRETPAPASPPIEKAPATAVEQIALGQKLYSEKCASCHGASGEGAGATPRVVGLKEGTLPHDLPASAQSATANSRPLATSQPSWLPTFRPNRPEP